MQKDYVVFSNNWERSPLKLAKKATIVLKNPGRHLNITANIATAAASRNPKKAISTLTEVIIFYHKGKGLCLDRFVWFYAILMEQKTDRRYLSAPLKKLI